MQIQPVGFIFKNQVVYRRISNLYYICLYDILYLYCALYAWLLLPLNFDLMKRGKKKSY